MDGPVLEYQHEVAAVSARDQHIALQARPACGATLARRKSFVNPRGSSARPNGCMRPVGVYAARSAAFCEPFGRARLECLPVIRRHQERTMLI
jgi:hypothetical protein